MAESLAWMLCSRRASRCAWSRSASASMSCARALATFACASATARLEIGVLEPPDDVATPHVRSFAHGERGEPSRDLRRDGGARTGYDVTVGGHGSGLRACRRVAASERGRHDRFDAIASRRGSSRRAGRCVPRAASPRRSRSRAGGAARTSTPACATAARCASAPATSTSPGWLGCTSSAPGRATGSCRKPRVASCGSSACVRSPPESESGPHGRGAAAERAPRRVRGPADHRRAIGASKA